MMAKFMNHKTARRYWLAVLTWVAIGMQQDIPGPEYSALKLLIDVCHSSCLAIMHPLVQGISSSASCFPAEDDLN